jgi:hypothetical protein
MEFSGASTVSVAPDCIKDPFRIRAGDRFLARSGFSLWTCQSVGVCFITHTLRVIGRFVPLLSIPPSVPELREAAPVFPEAKV